MPVLSADNATCYWLRRKKDVERISRKKRRPFTGEISFAQSRHGRQQLRIVSLSRQKLAIVRHVVMVSIFGIVLANEEPKLGIVLARIGARILSHGHAIVRAVSKQRRRGGSR